MSDFHRVIAGDVPYASDVNQYAEVLKGETDVGDVRFASSISRPSSVGTLALAAGTSLGVGTYQYALTYITGQIRSNGDLVISGETEMSTVSSITTTTNNQVVAVSAIPVAPVVYAAVIGKRLYRTAVGGSTFKLVATLTNATTSYSDTKADASLGSTAPTTNTTGTHLSVDSLSEPVSTQSYWRHNPLEATFSRTSVAYLSTGAQVASGAPRYDTVGGASGTWVEEATTNLLTANQASVETDTTGFSTASSFQINSGATITRVTTEKWHGNASLRVQTPGTTTAEGVETTGRSASASTSHTATTKVKAPVGASLLLKLRDHTNSISAPNVAFIGTGDWQEVSTTLTTGATAVTDLRMAVSVNGTAAVTFYIDGLQLEAKSYATSWHLPGTTKAEEQLNMPSASVNATRGTIEFSVNWCGGGDYGNLFAVVGSGGPDANALRLERNSNLDEFYLLTGDASGNWSTSPTFAIPRNTRKGIAVTWDEGTLSVLVDGVLQTGFPWAPTNYPASFDGATVTVGRSPSFTGRSISGHYGPIRTSDIARTTSAIANAWANGLVWDSSTVALYPMYATLSTGPMIGDHEMLHDGNVGKNASNDDIRFINALLVGGDTRSWTATTWNTSGRPTHIDIKDGATVVATLDIMYNTANRPTQAIIVVGGKTVTITQTFDASNSTKFVSRTKAVV